MVLRSDELANEAEVERDRNFRSNVGKTVKTAVGLGAAAIGGPIAARVMPFLNEYIPASLAMKGIEKVSPKLGSFLKKGQQMGLDIKDGLNFIKEKMGASEDENQTKEHRNIIEQYDPELNAYIKMNLGKGLNLMQAGKKALSHSRFKNSVDKLTKDHKISWDAILNSVYGHPSVEAREQPQQEEAQAPQNNQQQPGQGQAALMAILQKIQQSRGI